MKSRVLVTRSAHQASALASHLQRLGATPIVVPSVKLVSPSDEFSSLDAALSELSAFQWLVFTSSNAVESFAGRAGGLPLPANLRLAAIGSMTAKTVAEALKVPPASILLPPVAVAESLAMELRRHAYGQVLLVRAEAARDLLPDTLRSAGLSVTIAHAYRNVVPQGSVALLQGVFAQPGTQPDALTFTSASTVQHTLELLASARLSLPPDTVLASIGPITSAALKEAGLQADVEAPFATVQSLAEVTVSYLRERER